MVYRCSRAVLRAGRWQGPYLPGYEAVAAGAAGAGQESYGLRRLDHAVGNVHKMAEAISYLRAATGFHPFAEFTTEDVGTVDSGEALPAVPNALAPPGASVDRVCHL